MVQNIPKRNGLVKLLLLESNSSQIRKKLQKLFSDQFKCCNLKIVFTSLVRIKSFFPFRYKLPKMLLSGLVYNINVVAAMLPIMERLSAILKSKFVNI